MLHHELLGQADALLNTEKLDQAAIRRAISNAYYAVFHLIVQEGVDLLLGNEDKKISNYFQRSFDHSSMKGACEDIRKTILPNRHAPIDGPFPHELVQLSIIFVFLQKMRHDADYNQFEAISKAIAKESIKRAYDGIAFWNTMLETNKGAAKQFVTLLLLQKMKRN